MGGTQEVAAATTNPIQKKLATKKAIVCYAFGDIASQFVWTFVGSYLTIFYTDVVGLAPAIVSVIMLVSRIWDAINDPMMGAIAERTRSKWGRFRPWIAFGCPILAVFGVLTFSNPFSGQSTAGVIWAFATYIICGMVYTATNIPYSALAAVMTEDANQRNQLTSSRNIGMNIGMTIVQFLSPILLLAFSAPGAEVADSHGYTWTAVVYGALAIPMFLIVFFTSRENVAPVETGKKFSIKETVANLVKNKYLMIVSLVMLVQMTAFMGRIAVCAYWVIYCIGSFEMISIIMTLPTLLGIVGSLFVPKLARKFGKRQVLMGSMAIQAIGLLIMFFAPYDNMFMIMVGNVIFGLFNIGMPMTLSMVADSVDYMEYKTGARTDGTAYATYGLATKIGNAVGAALGVLIMTGFGYVANAEQTEQAMHGINVTVNLLPAILFLVAAALCFLWRMSDKDADDIREKLHERKFGKQNAEETPEQIETEA